MYQWILSFTVLSLNILLCLKSAKTDSNKKALNTKRIIALKPVEDIKDVGEYAGLHTVFKVEVSKS